MWKTFSDKDRNSVDWSRDDQVFEKMMGFFEFPEYREPVLSGVISTIGAEVVSESLADISKEKILKYIGV